MQRASDRPSSRAIQFVRIETLASSPVFPPFSSADVEEKVELTRPSTSARWGSDERARAHVVEVQGVPK